MFREEIRFRFTQRWVPLFWEIPLMICEDPVGGWERSAGLGLRVGWMTEMCRITIRGGGIIRHLVVWLCYCWKNFESCASFICCTWNTSALKHKSCSENPGNNIAQISPECFLHRLFIGNASKIQSTYRSLTGFRCKYISNILQILHNIVWTLGYIFNEKSMKRQ